MLLERREVTKQIAIFAVVTKKELGYGEDEANGQVKSPGANPVQAACQRQPIYLLDYYTGDVIRKENYVGGKRQYEFLKLYLIPERTREDKTKNEATLALAKAIQSKRIVEIQNDAHGFQNTNKSKVNLLDYLESIGKQSAERGSGNYARTVLNTVRALKLFRGDYIAFRDVDK